ncbi:MAG: DNA topology modulation protein [Saprospiraceae bacterium]
MKRIMIIGCSGSGKSTFSKKLNELTQIPIVHLDQKYWKPNWTESSEEEWRKTISEVVKKDQWIMDGNYSGTWDLRIPRADTIIFLDQPTYVCLYRVTKRIIANYGKTRPDMTADCPERFDLEFFHYVLVYNLMRRKSNLKKLESWKKEKQIFIFRKEKDIKAFFEDIKRS